MRRNMWPFGAGQPLGSKTTYHYGGGSLSTRRLSTRERASATKTAAKDRAVRESQSKTSKLDDPDIERKLKSHYSRGGTLNEFLSANPGSYNNFFDESSKGKAKTYHGYMIWPVWGGWKTSLRPLATFGSEAAVKTFIDSRPNPAGTRGEFQQCVDAVSAKGGAYDPRAVCAAMERRKGYINPTAADKSAAYRAGMAAMAAAAAKHGTVNLTPSIAQREEWGYAWREFMAGWKAEARRVVNPGDEPARAFVGEPRKDGKYPVQLVYPRSGVRMQKLMTQAQIDALAAKGYQVIGKKWNPSAAAAEVYEEFHGMPSTEIVEVTKRVHFHSHLAALGKLEVLVVQRAGKEHRLVGFKGAKLCCNERKNQLFVEGGDQALNASDFGFGREWPHERNTVGIVSRLEYFTTKKHLGSEGGTAIYFHEPGEPEKGRSAGVGPDLIYDAVNEVLEFSGGTYAILAEGISR